MVASADAMATQAGLAALDRGGSAADAAVATNAVLAVTAPHLCGMGGDLFALVHVDGDAPAALNASGRAGSGADPEALRDEGHRTMPMRHEIRTVTVPGCVDGWLALHARFGRLPLDEVLSPAIAAAERGTPASPLLVRSLAAVDARAGHALRELVEQATVVGARVRRPGIARALRAVAEHGRDGFYGGAFGHGLLALAPGYFTEEDLDREQADWVEPLTVAAWDQQLWTIPPNSQGYLTLAAAALVAGLPLPDDPDDPVWPHLLVEASRAVGYDRPGFLHERAEAADRLEPSHLAGLRQCVSTESMSNRWPAAPIHAGDTTYLCAVDGDRMAVSLIQSNAAGFGSWLVEPSTGINLHNRGLGFSLEDGHPAEYRPGRRPPHTLSPLLVTRTDGGLAGVIGTMGGDAQPQILLQLLARLFGPGRASPPDPAAAIAAGRWVLHSSSGFDTWSGPPTPSVAVEEHAPARWSDGLIARGHDVSRWSAYDSGFGHAHAILAAADDQLVGAADPRALIGSAAGR
jgi:gamma-glutamyltranspeptidase/glutathione hydrolase